MSGGSAVTLAALGDVEVSLIVAVGDARCSVNDVLDFRHGTVVPLTVAADAPVELLANGVAIATGEIVELDDGMLAVEIRSVRSHTPNGTSGA